MGKSTPIYLGWATGPTPETQRILLAAYKHIESVPYKVSLRWVFYRLYQGGIYKDKRDYDAFGMIASRARHDFYNGW